jgi:hypothetical protein
VQAKKAMSLLVKSGRRRQKTYGTVGSSGIVSVIAGVVHLRWVLKLALATVSWRIPRAAINIGLAAAHGRRRVVCVRG